MRQANSPLEESIAKKYRWEGQWFWLYHGGRFWPHKNQRPIGVWPFEQFSHRMTNKEDGFWDGLDRDLGSIKIKILVFQGKNNP